MLRSSTSTRNVTSPRIFLGGGGVSRKEKMLVTMN
jgi:hypothetical protein